MQLSNSEEDYLKAIYILHKGKRKVRSIDVAEYLGVSKPSVSHAVKLLGQKGFLIMNEDYSLQLTETGADAAKSVHERYQFFKKHLMSAGVDMGIAEHEACKMEHAIGDFSFQRLREKEKQACPFMDSCTRNRKDIQSGNEQANS